MFKTFDFLHIWKFEIKRIANILNMNKKYVSHYKEKQRISAIINGIIKWYIIINRILEYDIHI